MSDTTWYHGSPVWPDIDREGVLWGKRDAPSRCTYLARDRREAAKYGEVRAVVYQPQGMPCDNYVPGCWQLRVYVPIRQQKDLTEGAKI